MYFDFMDRIVCISLHIKWSIPATKEVTVSPGDLSTAQDYVRFPWLNVTIAVSGTAAESILSYCSMPYDIPTNPRVNSKFALQITFHPRFSIVRRELHFNDLLSSAPCSSLYFHQTSFDKSSAGKEIRDSRRHLLSSSQFSPVSLALL